MCRQHGATGISSYYVSRTPDKVIDLNKNILDQLDIPDWDTSNYGWILDK
ncbi:MAG: hypothetical protein IJ593_06910 [Lachnospiraceae bacterium]|nr:hypothetical protein [Lachnospiraceae bacterium]